MSSLYLDEDCTDFSNWYEEKKKEKPKYLCTLCSDRGKIKFHAADMPDGMDQLYTYLPCRCRTGE